MTLDGRRDGHGAGEVRRGKRKEKGVGPSYGSLKGFELETERTRVREDGLDQLGHSAQQNGCIAASKGQVV